jgi:gluconolactonase
LSARLTDKCVIDFDEWRNTQHTTKHLRNRFAVIPTIERLNTDFAGKLQVISRDFTGPNGIAFSPDEKYLYVGNWDEKKKVVMRYEAKADGTLANGKLFFDMTSAKGEDALDGIKVDQQGNLYVSGPGGLWVISSEGKHLGTIITPKHVHNMAWGDDDGKPLYLCARSGLYRMRLGIAGTRPAEISRR